MKRLCYFYMPRIERLNCLYAVLSCLSIIASEEPVGYQMKAHGPHACCDEAACK
jgi:hypothetical protein